MKHIFLILATLLCCSNSKANDWYSHSVSLLYGDDFKFSDDKTISTLTLEHAGGWGWGSSFAFIDYTKPQTGDSSYYLELSPRFKLMDLGGSVSTFYLATTYENGKGGYRAYLAGPGIDLDVSGFAFVQTAVYKRHIEGASGDSYQLTTAWKYPFNIGDTSWAIQGFFDWVFDNHDGSHANMHFVPQILWDATDTLGLSIGKLYFGSEIDIWQNKYGVEDSSAVDSNQRAVNIMATWSF